MQHLTRHPFRRLIAMALGIVATSSALADAPLRVATIPQYQQECSSCHIAYAPAMLPKASWTRLMGNLPRHFGSDASLDAGTTRTLTSWLEANAGTYKRVTSESPPEDRISRSPWFIRKHREVASEVWKRPAVRSAANCAACHPKADQGDFNEHAIRIPR